MPPSVPADWPEAAVPGECQQPRGGKLASRNMLFGRYPHKRSAGHQACRSPTRPPKVGRISIALESEQVRAEQARNDLPPPG